MKWLTSFSHFKMYNYNSTITTTTPGVRLVWHSRTFPILRRIFQDSFSGSGFRQKATDWLTLTDLSPPMRKKSRSAALMQSTQEAEHLKVFWIQLHLELSWGFTHMREMLMEQHRDKTRGQNSSEEFLWLFPVCAHKGILTIFKMIVKWWPGTYCNKSISPWTLSFSSGLLEYLSWYPCSPTLYSTKYLLFHDFCKRECVNQSFNQSINQSMQKPAEGFPLPQTWTVLGEATSAGIQTLFLL